MTTPRLAIPEIAENQAQKYLTHNAALRILDFIVQGGVISRTNTPPVTPLDGDAYIVGASPTGIFVSRTNYVACYTNGAWVFIYPRVGWSFWSTADSGYYTYNTSPSNGWYPNATSGLALTGGSMGGAINEFKGADISSVSGDISPFAAGNYVHITGTTTITALGTVQAGSRRIVKFTGILTLTHNDTSLILPGAANITTAAGDHAEFVSLGSGNWICVAYFRATGAPLYFTLSGAFNELKGADIASATTTDIGAATGNYVHVTGTTTITGLGTIAAGARRVVKFTGALLLTHNATSLILPTASDITTVANDIAVFISLGSGNWICVSYHRTNGSAINEKQGADIASATTTDIGAATGNFINVTGTTTITGLGTVLAGTRRIVKFTGALLLTYNATSLILPTAASITTVAGDTAEFVSLGSGNWLCTYYTRADGSLVSGSSENFSIITDATTARTLALTDASKTSAPKYLRMTSSSANAITVPPNSSVAFTVGAQVNIRQGGTGATTIVAGSGVTINVPFGGTLVSAGQGANLTLVKVATDTWDLMGQTT